MRTLLLFTILAGLASAVHAEGPGSRIRATPSGPQSPGASHNDAKRCAQLRDEAKDRCMKQARDAAAADRRTRGPESVGGTPAASGASGASK